VQKCNPELTFQTFVKPLATERLRNEIHAARCQRLLAMCRDSSSSSHAGVLSTLVPELEPLAEGTAQALLGLAAAVRTQSKGFDLGPLDNAVETVDRRLQHLRDTQATSPVSLDRMLPFWSFLFNLKEVVAGVRSLNAKLARLS